MRTPSVIDKRKNPINVFNTPVMHTNMLAQFAPGPLALLKVNVEGDASSFGSDRDLGEKQGPPMLTSLGNGEDRLSPAEISKYNVFIFLDSFGIGCPFVAIDKVDRPRYSRSSLDASCFCSVIDLFIYLSCLGIALLFVFRIIVSYGCVPKHVSQLAGSEKRKKSAVRIPSPVH